MSREVYHSQPQLTTCLYVLYIESIEIELFFLLAQFAKLAKYCKYSKLCDLVFVIFAVMFFVTRLIIYPFRYLCSFSTFRYFNALTTE